MLAPAQVQRYARQILVPEVGRAGQERWLDSRLVAIGEGEALEAAVELVSAAGVAVERDNRAAGTEAGPTGAASAGTEAGPTGLASGTGSGPTGLARLGELIIGETAFVDRRAGCERCIAAFFASQPRLEAAERPAIAFATGAAAAAEALLQLLDSRRPPIGMAFAPEPRRVALAHGGPTCRP